MRAGPCRPLRAPKIRIHSRREHVRASEPGRWPLSTSPELKARAARACLLAMTTDHIGHRICPFCGVWMVVRKADREGAANDTFECALCRTVIYVPRDDDGQPKQTDAATRATGA